MTKRHPDRTRAAILAAARAEFAEFGLDGARVGRIAARAGANKRMLYHYVGNKEALYARALVDACREMADVSGALSEDAPPAAALADLVGLVFDQARRNPRLVRLLTAETMQRGATLAGRPELLGVAAPLVAGLARILAAGAADGSLRADADASELAASILALATFPLMPALGPLLGTDLESEAAATRRRAHVVALVLAAVRP